MEKLEKKTTFGEMASVMGNVAPTANALNVSTEELFSSLAVLTANGIQTSEAATGLKAAFSNVIKPSKGAMEAAESLGLEFSASAVATKGWGNFLVDVTDKLQQAEPEYVKAVQKQSDLTLQMAEMEKAGKKSSDEYKALKDELKSSTKEVELLEGAADSQIGAFSTMFGSVEALNTVLTLTSDQGMGLYNESMSTMAGETDFVTEAYDTMSSTTSSSLARTKEEFKNTLGTFGEQLLPVVNDILKSFSNILSSFNELSPETKNFILGFLGIVAVVGPLLVAIGTVCKAIVGIKGAFDVVKKGFDGLKKLKFKSSIDKVGGALGKLKKGFSGFKNLKIISSVGKIGGAFTKLKGAMSLSSVVGLVTGPALPIVGAIAGIAGAGILVVKNWDKIKETAGKVWQGMKDGWAGMKEWASDTWTGIKDAVSTSFTAVKEKVGEIASGAVTKVKEKWANTKQWASDTWTGVKEGVSTAFSTVKEKVGEIASGTVSKVKEKWSNTKQWASDTWTGVKEGASTAFSTVKEKVGEIASGTVSKVKEKWSNTKQWASDTWTGIKESTSNAFSGIKEKVSTTAKGAVDNVQEKWSGTKEKASNLWGGVSESSAEAFSNVKDKMDNIVLDLGRSMAGGFTGIKEKTVEIASSISKGVEGAVGFIKDLPSKMFEWGTHMIDGFIRGIKSMIGKVTGAVKSVAETITSWLHFTRPDVGPLRQYEEWMPHFMQGLSTGIEQNKYHVERSVRGLAEGMVINSDDIVNPNLMSRVISNISSSKSGLASAIGNLLNVDGISSKLILKPQEVVSATSKDIRNVDDMSNSGYVIQGPLLTIDTVIVRDDSDIDKISRGIYNANMNVIRGLGKRG